jgi:hypothetical protein
MKYFTRAGIYKANGNVTFNPTTCEAYSYNWWAFVKKIKGKVIFNAYRYSVTTSKHQSRVRSLMSDLGIKIDRVVQVAGGLQSIKTISELNKKESETLLGIEVHNELMRSRRLARAKQLRLAKKKAAQEQANAETVSA